MNKYHLAGLVCTLALTLSACGSGTPQVPTGAQGPSTPVATDPVTALDAFGTASTMSNAQAQVMFDQLQVVLGDDLTAGLTGGAPSTLQPAQLQSMSGKGEKVSQATYAFKGTVSEGPSKGTVLEGDLALKVRTLNKGVLFVKGTLAGKIPVRGLIFADGSSIFLFKVEPQGIFGRGVPGKAESLSGVFFGPNISGGDQGQWTAALKPAAAAQSSVRALHGSSDTPAVDLFVDGTKVSPAAGFTFRTTFPANAAGGGYAQLPAGKRMVKVCATGTTVCPVDAALNLAADTRYTVAVIGTLKADDDHGETPRPITPLVLEDRAPNKPAEAQVRLVHAAANPAADKVDVYVTAPGANLASASPAIAGFKYGKDSGYLALKPGDYQVRITLPQTKTVVIDSGKLSLVAGKVFTAFAVDPVPGSKDFGAVLLQDN
jgi:Domain of unknown function (DUF4397)